MSDLTPIPHYTFSGKPFIQNYMFGEGNMTCSDFADPDQAGIGVVVSGVIVALATAITSWVAYYLNPKSKPSEPSEPSEQPEPSEQSKLSPKEVWREVAESALFSLADQQLVTGIALLASAYVNIREYTLYKEDKLDFQDAHFTLVIYQSCLSLSSYFACLISLREFQGSPAIIPRQSQKHPATIYIRLVFITLFALSLTVTVAISDQAFLPIFYVLQGTPGPDDNILFSKFSRDLRRGLSAAAVMLTYCFSLIHALWPKRIEKLKERIIRRNNRCQSVCKVFVFFLSKEWALLLYSAYVLLFIVFVNIQKWDKPPEVSEVAQDLGIKQWCGLNNDGENRWVFGQTVAMTMLLLPTLSVLDAYFEAKQRERGG
ncbi:hypothetical protein DL98DRAFT_600288 [Cadophora sp. DSE1049]|nr:hypothetical protein DL98DRAFT_600288 [Cadophora sp. DSE1049]